MVVGHRSNQHWGRLVGRPSLRFLPTVLITNWTSAAGCVSNEFQRPYPSSMFEHVGHDHQLVSSGLRIHCVDTPPLGIGLTDVGMTLGQPI
ncbi:hypothetical protein EDF70_11346 [Neorhizobium sp. JUb45]|nr:hypothetical protein EDF70_11346 [Neorhizobium sp. JUb45]